MTKQEKHEIHQLAKKFILNTLTDEEVMYIIKNYKDEKWNAFQKEVEKHSPKNAGVLD